VPAPHRDVRVVRGLFDPCRASRLSRSLYLHVAGLSLSLCLYLVASAHQARRRNRGSGRAAPRRAPRASSALQPPPPPAARPSAPLRQPAATAVALRGAVHGQWYGLLCCMVGTPAVPALAAAALNQMSSCRRLCSALRSASCDASGVQGFGALVWTAALIPWSLIDTVECGYLLPPLGILLRPPQPILPPLLRLLLPARSG
jgi:hypothetical protein